MRYLLLLIALSATLGAQIVSSLPLGNGGGMVRPAGDRTLSNVLLGSGVTPQGQVSYTKDIYLLKPDGSAPKRLTTFDQTNYAPGATGVALSRDGTRAAYLAILNSGGKRSEEVHAIDPVTGTDRLLAVDTAGCVQPKNVCPDCYNPCLQNASFSQDGSEVIWNANGTIFVAEYDGSGVRQLASGSVSETPNVTTNDNRLIFLNLAGVQMIGLDGSGLTSNNGSGGGVFFTEATISADASTSAVENCGDMSSGPNIGCRLSDNRAALDRSPIDSFSGVTLSSDGSVAAWIDMAGYYTGAGILKVFAGIAGTALSFTTPAFDATFPAKLRCEYLTTISSLKRTGVRRYCGH
jgi:hypothetical protein